MKHTCSTGNLEYGCPSANAVPTIIFLISLIFRMTEANQLLLTSQNLGFSCCLHWQKSAASTQAVLEHWANSNKDIKYIRNFSLKVCDSVMSVT
jgi:hypothetical protein